MKNRGIFKDINGQGIVEFALIIPLLFILIFGVIDFSRLAYYKSTLNHTAKEALRSLSVGSNIYTVVDSIEDMIYPITGDVTSNITTGTDDEGNSCTKVIFTPASGNSLTLYITPYYTNSLQVGDKIRVFIDYNINNITPLSGSFGSTRKITSKYRTRIEKPPL